MSESGGTSVNSILQKSNSELVLSEIPDESKSTSQYQIKPSLKDGFQGHAIKEIISNVLVEVLVGKCIFRIMCFWYNNLNENVSYNHYLLQVNNTQVTRYKSGQVKFLTVLVRK